MTASDDRDVPKKRTPKIRGEYERPPRMVDGAPLVQKKTPLDKLRDALRRKVGE